MSEYTEYNCSCLDEIEKDITHYLDNRPEITKILGKENLDAEDVISFIKTMNEEIGEVIQYYRMKSELKLLRRSYMEEEYLDDANFNYNIHRRVWFDKPCPSSINEVDTEEDVMTDGIDYYCTYNRYNYIDSCDTYPGIQNMIITCMETYMYNMLSSGIINKYLHIYQETSEELMFLLKNLERQLATTLDYTIYSRQWVSSWYYFYSIFKFPKYFSKYYIIYDYFKGTDKEDKLINTTNENKQIVDISKCKMEYNVNFKEIIKSHPLALNGKFQ